MISLDPLSLVIAHDSQTPCLHFVMQLFCYKTAAKSLQSEVIFLFHLFFSTLKHMQFTTMRHLVHYLHFPSQPAKDAIEASPQEKRLKLKLSCIKISLQLPSSSSHVGSSYHDTAPDVPDVQPLVCNRTIKAVRRNEMQLWGSMYMVPTNKQTGCFGLNRGTFKDLKQFVAAHMAETPLQKMTISTLDFKADNTDHGEVFRVPHLQSDAVLSIDCFVLTVILISNKALFNYY